LSSTTHLSHRIQTPGERRKGEREREREREREAKRELARQVPVCQEGFMCRP
jgi:hypothetical protein